MSFVTQTLSYKAERSKMMTIHLTTVLLCILVWTSMPDNSSSFILDTQTCMAFSPCTCSGSYVRCDWKGLTSFPTFKVSNVSGSSIYFYIRYNQLTTVPANAFRNLSVSNNTDISMYLSNNHLNNIAVNAFAGIADSIAYLYLHSNNFTSIPSELQSLSKLGTLNLRNNPISSLSPSTMHVLGRHLHSLYIDLNYFNTWPTEINLLTSLTLFHVRYLNMNHLDYDVFDGFANTLHTLYIGFTQLEKIPVAVCHLHNLQSLAFEHNDNVHINNTVFEPCRNLTHVTSINLTGNKLKYMPDVFRSFPSMTTLKISSNQVSFIHWDTIPSNHPLTYLDMNYNDFTRIPTAINKLQALVTLFMQGNKITSVEDLDLSSLGRLRYLYLKNNPIQYISPHAFKNNLVLYELYLQYTNLRQLPSSIAGLHNLRYLYLQGSPIECNCDMSVLKSWNVTNIFLDGDCKASPIHIKSYLTDDLPNCP